MNYSAAIGYNTRKGPGEPPAYLKYFQVKEIYIKIFAVVTALACIALVVTISNI